MPDKMIINISVQCENDSSFRVYTELKTMIDSYIKYNNLPNDEYLSFSIKVREAEVMRVDTDGSKLYKE